MCDKYGELLWVLARIERKVDQLMTESAVIAASIQAVVTDLNTDFQTLQGLSTTLESDVTALTAALENNDPTAIEAAVTSLQATQANLDSATSTLSSSVSGITGLIPASGSATEGTSADGEPAEGTSADGEPAEGTTPSGS
jgi:predicted  nucleic acid-binding Zn-ribbon protein